MIILAGTLIVILMLIIVVLSEFKKRRNFWAELTNEGAVFEKKAVILQPRTEFETAVNGTEFTTLGGFAAVANGGLPPLKKLGLLGWLDKISWGEYLSTFELLSRTRIPRPMLYYSTYAYPPNVMSIISGLDRYVIKPSHLADKEGVMIIVDNIEEITRKELSKEDVSKKACQSFALQLKHPTLVPKAGLIIEEFIPADFEARFFVVWGRVVLAKLYRRINLEVFSFVGSGLATRNGTWAPIHTRAEITKPPMYDDYVKNSCWAIAVGTVENVSTNTDYVAIDVMFSDGLFYVGNCFPRREKTGLPSEFEDVIAGILSNGYKYRFISDRIEEEEVFGIEYEINSEGRLRIENAPDSEGGSSGDSSSEDD